MTTAGRPLPRPQIEGSIKLKGLKGGVEVVRDRWGVPHLRAQNDADLWFGQGFVHAQDRLWQMEEWRYKSQGRLAELYGRRALEEDRVARRLGLHASAARDWALYDRETRALFEAFTRGVNAFLEQGENLPLEFELLDHHMQPWTPVDCIAVFKVNHAFMVTWPAKVLLARVLARFGVERTAAVTALYPEDHPLLVPPGVRSGPINVDVEALLRNLAGLLERAEAGAGSNNWVIDGSKSRSGLPLLATDTHRAPAIPSWYYEQHLLSPGIHAAGLSFAGVPGITHFGHTDHVAFALTHSYTDTTSLYVEQFDRDGRRYRYKGEWYDARVRRERYAVRGEPDFEEEIVETVHGPLVPQPVVRQVGAQHAVPLRGEQVAVPLALRFTDAEPGKTLTCILPILRARSVDELDAGLREWLYPCQNFIFADTTGNIGFRLRGRVPVRPRQSAILPLDGASGEDDWRGWIPFDEMPAIKNPTTHAIVTANNRTVGDDFPHDLGIVASAGYRAQRIFDLLGEYDRCGPEEFASIHADRFSIPAAQLIPWLTAVLSDEAGVERQALELLRDWDYRVDATSAAAAIYELWLVRLEANALRPVIGEQAPEMLGSWSVLRPMLIDQILAGDTTLLTLGGVDPSWELLARRSLQEAVAWLRRELGDDPAGWKWGALHRLNVRHPLAGEHPELVERLNPPPLPLGGDSNTVNVASYPRSAPFDTTGVPVHRLIIDLADFDNSLSADLFGQSGQPGSPHYFDQLQHWHDVAYHPMLWSWDRVLEQAEGTLTLEPLP